MIISDIYLKLIFDPVEVFLIDEGVADQQGFRFMWKSRKLLVWEAVYAHIRPDKAPAITEQGRCNTCLEQRQKLKLNTWNILPRRLGLSV